MQLRFSPLLCSLTLAALFLAPHLAAAYTQGTYYSQPAYYTQTTYYSQGTYENGYNITITKAASTTGNLTVLSNFRKGSGTFVIDHPLDPKNRLLYHSFVESPDAKNLYDGIATLDSAGEAVVRFPAYFMALNKDPRDYRYQLSPIGEPMPGLYVKSGIAAGRFVIGGGVPGGRVSWQVTAIRKDAYIVANPIIPEVRKDPKDTVAEGEFIHEGLYYNFPSPLQPFRDAWSYASGLIQ